MLQTELKAVRRQVSDLESRLDRAENTAARHKIAEFDKRERKVLERKLADMEKDLLVREHTWIKLKIHLSYLDAVTPEVAVVNPRFVQLPKFFLTIDLSGNWIEKARRILF